jgi:hypothetical protein
LAKLIQGLAIVEMELVEESASAWIGQGFEDIVHAEQRYATKRLHISLALANPVANCSHVTSDPPRFNALARISSSDKACGSRSR